MNAVTKHVPQSVPAVTPSGSTLMPSDMSGAIRLAEMMATAKLVPPHLQGKPGDCLMVIEQAMRWGMSPFAVAQCTSVIQGRLMFEGKLVAAALESSSILDGHLDYEFDGKGDTREITVIATRRGETKPRDVNVKIKDVKTTNGMWVKQPDQQLVYSGTRVWARRWAPGVMLGVYTPEEFDDPQRPFSGVTVDAAPEQTEAPPSYDDKIANMVRAFAGVGVKPEALVQWLNHPLTETTEAEMGELRTVLMSIRDGKSTADDHFGYNGIKDRREAQGKALLEQAEAEEAAKAATQKPVPLNVTLSRAPAEPPPPGDEVGQEYYLVDEYGEPVGDPLATAHDYAVALAGLHSKSIKKANLLQENSVDIENARHADEEAARILDALRGEEADAVPVSLEPVKVPLNRQGSKDTGKYIEDIKADLAKQDAATIDRWPAINEPTYSDMPTKYKMMVLQELGDRREALGLPRQKAAPDEEPKPDPADALIADIENCADKNALDVMLAMKSTEVRRGRLDDEQNKRVEIAIAAVRHGFGEAP